MLSSSTKLKFPKPKNLLFLPLNLHNYFKIQSDLHKYTKTLPLTLTKSFATTPPPPPRMQSPLLPITAPSSSSAVRTLLRGEIEEQQQHRRSLFSSFSSREGGEEKKKPLLCANEEESKRGDEEAGNGEMSTEEVIDRNVGHAAAETYLITRLGLILLKYLGLGYRWIMRFAALGLYAVLLMPGFLQVGYYYYTSKQIKRSIIYGDQPRNRLDLYLPPDSDGLKPVVAFVTGGAWIIGYKAWGTALGLQLAEKDIIVACIDYRNFPQATISDMVNDASQGISFVCNNIAEYGGDPNRVYVMGQSAGAHISSCAIVEKAIQECGEGENSSWSVSQVKAYFGLSGGYNLPKLVDHFHGRGLYRSIFLSIMEGDQSLGRFSPEVLVQDPNFKSAVPLLPPFVLFHGTADYSIPSDASKDFVESLQRVGAQAELVLYEGKTHTDLFVQDSLRGGTDKLVSDVVSFVHAGDEAALAKDALTPPRRRLVPECMLKLARKISPF